MSLEEAARQAPTVSLVHNVPGVVKSGIGRDAQGVKVIVTMAISNLLGSLIHTPPSECGERQVFFATSAMCPPRERTHAAIGMPLPVDLGVARGTNSKSGSGVYSVSDKGDPASPKVEQLLDEFRRDRTAQKIWDYTEDMGTGFRGLHTDYRK